MSILHMDGFDKYAAYADLSAEYTTLSSLINFPATSGRFGGRAVSFGSTSSQHYIRKALPATYTTLWQACAFNIQSGTGTAISLFTFIQGTTSELSLVYSQTTQVLSVKRGRTDGTVLGSQAGTTGTGWHWIEIGMTHDDAAGTVEVWVDGTRIINLSGVDTKVSASAGIDAVCIGNNGFSSGTGSLNGWPLDDWIISTTHLGDCRIDTLIPNADAGPNDGTISTGATHYGVVDEIPPNGDTDYTTLTNTTGQAELFGITDLLSAPAAILGVQINTQVRKDDAGAASGKPFVVSGAVTAKGNTFTPGTDYQSGHYLLEVDPATGAAWTVTALNALKAGYEVQ